MKKCLFFLSAGLWWRKAWPHPPRHHPSNAYWEVLCVCVSVTDTLSSRRPELRSVQRSMQDSLSMVESWRKVIPGLSMIKLTPHRVSQIRFCALDTVAAAYSTLSRVLSHLSCWHHCIAITVSERETALGQRGGKRIKAMLSVCLPAYLSFSWSTNINQEPHHTNVGNLTLKSIKCQSSIESQKYCTADFSMCVFAAFSHFD